MKDIELIFSESKFSIMMRNLFLQDQVQPGFVEDQSLVAEIKVEQKSSQAREEEVLDKGGQCV